MLDMVLSVKRKGKKQVTANIADAIRVAPILGYDSGVAAVASVTSKHGQVIVIPPDAPVYLSSLRQLLDAGHTEFEIRCPDATRIALQMQRGMVLGYVHPVSPVDTGLLGRGEYNIIKFSIDPDSRRLVNSVVGMLPYVDQAVAIASAMSAATGETHLVEVVSTGEIL